MKRLVGLVLFLVSFSSSAQQLLQIKKELKEYVALNDSVYLNKYEVKVEEYLDYLQMVRVDSSRNFYLSQVPDSNSIGYMEVANTYYKMPYYPGYLNYPSYWSYPIVGISYQQALNFCKWKTNASRFAAKGQPYLMYRLPSPEEWKAAAIPGLYKSKGYTNYENYYVSLKLLDSLGIKRGQKKVYRTTFNVKDVGLFIYKDSIYKYIKMPPDQYMPKEQPEPVSNSIENKLGLFHLEDNVSEMTSVPGLAKGLNFLSSYRKNIGEVDIKYSAPEPWLGFRLVAEVKRK